MARCRDICNRKWLAAILAPLLLVLLGEACLRLLLYAQEITSRDLGETFEMYAIGGSTALGQPYGPKLNAQIFASSLLGDRIDGRKIANRNLAELGESIYPQSIRLAKAIRHRDPSAPGVLLVYSGHNDRIFLESNQKEPRFARLRSLVLDSSLLMRDIFAFAERRSILAAPRSTRLYEQYLRTVIEGAREKGLTPILVIEMANIAEIEPGLRPTPKMRAPQITAFIDAGRRLERSGRLNQAIAHYQAGAAAHPEMRAYMAFRIGKCHEQLGAFERANRYFWDAVDEPSLDHFPRIATRQRALLLSLAEEYGLRVVDVRGVFEARSKNGLVGSEFFADGHHPNLAGYALIGKALAEQISSLTGHRGARTRNLRDVMRALAFGREDESEAHSSSGIWLLTVSCGHADPALRLALAERSFRRAIKIFPDNFSAWLGLALVKAAQSTRMLQDEERVAWLRDRNLLFYGRRYNVTRQIFDELLPMLRQSGVPSAILDGVAARSRFAQ